MAYQVFMVNDIMEPTPPRVGQKQEQGLIFILARAAIWVANKESVGKLK